MDNTAGIAGLARRYLPEILPVHKLVSRLLRSLAAGARGRLQSICLVLLLFGILMLLGSTAAAPFIYTLF